MFAGSKKHSDKARVRPEAKARPEEKAARPERKAATPVANSEEKAASPERKAARPEGKAARRPIGGKVAKAAIPVAAVAKAATPVFAQPPFFGPAYEIVFLAARSRR